MSAVKNLIGQRFGRLLVTKRAGSDKDGRALWECQCDCGNVIAVSGILLRNGHTRSCGCLKAQSGKPLIDLIVGAEWARELQIGYSSILYFLKRDKSMEWIVNHYQNCVRKGA